MPVPATADLRYISSNTARVSRPSTSFSVASSSSTSPLAAMTSHDEPHLTNQADISRPVYERPSSDGRWASRLAVLLPNTSISAHDERKATRTQERDGRRASHDVSRRSSLHSTATYHPFDEEWALADGSIDGDAEEARATVARLRKELEAAQCALVDHVTHSQFRWREMAKVERLRRQVREAEIRAAGASTTLVSVAAAAAAAGPARHTPQTRHAPTPTTAERIRRRRASLASLPSLLSGLRRFSRDGGSVSGSPDGTAGVIGSFTSSSHAETALSRRKHTRQRSCAISCTSSPLAVPLAADSPIATTVRAASVLDDGEVYSEHDAHYQPQLDHAHHHEDALDSLALVSQMAKAARYHGLDNCRQCLHEAALYLFLHTHTAASEDARLCRCGTGLFILAGSLHLHVAATASTLLPGDARCIVLFTAPAEL
ncbi:hypothetical protein THASP1DRAFT_23571 [Thamnocephalis sphaerospora]|uniref:Uncharacterized protein n=1 Tax=Thamnocephalis sphaerospora TaxID=78915 RepID=A0A4P9XQU2_9FUNG|nr:hypothetical protein THASP1DRAFT_23571 [Thamnocephalis sphaerospora]|eukprot:RKP08433.1 hypothetical protein THASP1DRAFT_23571 [Thamnocephalis sphaerospora]